jgi:mannose-1-phosphate guanylyltransferase/phosphomannomutase
LLLTFAGDDKGGFIFPEFQPVFDAMVSLGRLLEFLGRSGLKLSEARANLPKLYKQQVTVDCPWEHKGTIMRKLHEQVADLTTEHIDGIKIYLESGWVLVLPDIEAPLFHVYGESRDPATARSYVEHWSNRITEIQGHL